MSIPSWFLSLPAAAACLPFFAGGARSEPSAESFEAETARSRVHYRTVVEELRAAETSTLSPERAALRAQLVEVLERYEERAEFGIAPRDADGRPAVFVDDGGRRCAVAELLHASGRDDVVERVHATHNGAWVAELAHDADVVQWLDEHGLSLAEAARIQYVVHRWVEDPPTPSGPPPGRGSTEGASRGSSTPSKSGSTATAQAAPSGPSTATSAPTAPTSVPTGPPGLASTTDDAWWVWWELNKAQFLRPQRISLRHATGGGDDAQDALDAFFARHRRAVTDVLHAGLVDSDSNVRGAALLALGRFGGGDAVARIVALLGDPNQAVRHRAILALGSTGAPQALRPLMSLIRTGTVDGTTRVSPVAEPLAIVAAALGRSRAHGFPSEMDAIVTVRVRERNAADREPVGCAAMMYQALAPCSSLEALAFEIARDERESLPTRCRAIEALRHSEDERALPLLQTLLVGSRLDLRRSAALALGELRDPLALPALLSASEMEAESLTRGFVLVSIGRRGGEKARDFLLAELSKGSSVHRPWCAIALGLVAHGSDSAAIGGELRGAFAREKNRQAEGAYCVALGLARDPAAVPLLARATRESARAQTRAYAATALGMIDAAEAHTALAAHVARESQPEARVIAAFALGSMGAESDIALLGTVLRDVRDRGNQELAASALAFHGSPEALALLEEAASAMRDGSAARAAAIDGLGIMLDDELPFRLGEAGRQSNHTQMPDWLQGALELSL